MNKIMPINLTGSSTHINMLCYGLPGVGKTRAIATAPKPYLLNIENNLMSLRGEKHIVGSTVTDWPQVKAVLRTIEERVKAGTCPYETLCIDSLSEMGNIRLAYGEDVEGLSGFTLWGIIAKDLLTWLRRLKALPIHLYVVCQAQKDKDEKSGTLTVSPSLVGNRMSRELPYIFDEVFLLERSVDRDGVASSMFKTYDGGNTIVKDHSGKLSQFEPPNLTNVFNKALSIDISEFNNEDKKENSNDK